MIRKAQKKEYALLDNFHYKGMPFMRIRPYIPNKDYEYVSKWIDDERAHVF